MPYWEAITDDVVNYRNEWVVETEALDETYRAFDRFYVDSNGAEIDVLPWEWSTDTEHFTERRILETPRALINDCPNSYIVFRPSREDEAGIGRLECGGPLLVNQMPNDCFGPENLGEPPFEFLTYLYFQDPSFGGVFHTKTSSLQRANTSAYEDSSCFNSALNSSDYVEANLWSLHRGSFALYEWFSEANDLIFGLIYPQLFDAPDLTSGGFNNTPSPLHLH